LFTQVEAESAVNQAKVDIEKRTARQLPPLLTNFSQSHALYEEAKKHLPSGASSNVRVYAHEPFPISFQKGQGSRVWDVDNNQYVDLLSSYGAVVLGHAHPAILNAINAQIRNGTMLGTTTELEVEVAKKIQSAVPCAEMVSFANTGTEATMEAIRIARAFTGRDKIVKFEGHYHGHHDYLKSMRELADKYDALLIFDEVLTGFRIAPGGAQEFYGVKPDIACYAKALGGGTPIAAVAGRGDVMGMIGPGKIGYGGTYNGNSMCLAAANATLDELLRDDASAIRHMHLTGAEVMEGLRELMSRYDHGGIVQGMGPMFQLYFTTARKIQNYRHTLQSDFEKFRRFRNLMLRRGVYFHPDGTERMMITAAHENGDVESILSAAEDSLRELKKPN